MRKMKKVSHRRKSHSPKASIREHARALSLGTAKEANKDGIVKNFRSKILRGRLLSWHQVQAWVEDQAARDRKGLDPDQPPADDQNFLYYAGPDRIEKFLRPHTDGVLSRLRCVSESLSRRYGWQPHQATLFILTGKAPLMPLIDHSIGGTRTISFSKFGPRLIDTPRTISLKFNSQFIGKKDLENYCAASTHQLRVKRPRPLEQRTLKQALIGKGRHAVSKKLSRTQFLRTMESLFKILGAQKVVSPKVALPPTLNLNQVQAVTQRSRATIYRWIQTGVLPKPDKSSGHARWVTEEIERIAQEGNDRKP
jgi:predicted DNA-binding transcriptional regulator AlpA